MAEGRLKTAGKNSLPFAITSVLCGYINHMVPEIFPEGEMRQWAYSTIPMLSLVLLYIIRTIKDFGTMSLARLAITICATPEKKRLKLIMPDKHVSEETKAIAEARYNQIIQKELEIGSNAVDYVVGMPIVHNQPRPTIDE
ncbi:hypothetical protein ABOI87_004907 [Escherichia coli]